MLNYLELINKLEIIIHNTMFIILSLVIDVNQFPGVAIMRIVIFLKTLKFDSKNLRQTWL